MQILLTSGPELRSNPPWSGCGLIEFNPDYNLNCLGGIHTEGGS